MNRKSGAALCLSILVGLGGCSRPAPPSPGEAQACQELEKKLNQAEDTFIARAREIRAQRILLRDYDKAMIEALSAYRDQALAVLDEEKQAAQGASRCSGTSLEEIKINARPQLDRLRGYLSTFYKALRVDPPNVYVP